MQEVVEMRVDVRFVGYNIRRAGYRILNSRAFQMRDVTCLLSVWYVWVGIYTLHILSRVVCTIGSQHHGNNSNLVAISSNSLGKPLSLKAGKFGVNRTAVESNLRTPPRLSRMLKSKFIKPRRDGKQ